MNCTDPPIDFTPDAVKPPPAADPVLLAEALRAMLVEAAQVAAHLAAAIAARPPSPKSSPRPGAAALPPAR